MKVIKQILIGVFATMAAVTILYMLESVVTHEGCIEISVFDSIASTIHVINALLTIIGIYLFGLVRFFIIKIWLKINTHIYFTVLTIISTYPIFRSIYNDIATEDTNSKIKISICEKIKDDGMMCEISHLTFEEYEFCTHGHNWLPKCPATKQAISIKYYSDNFLGDYDLNIEIIVSQSEKLDSVVYSDCSFVERMDTNLLLYNHNQGQG